MSAQFKTPQKVPTVSAQSYKLLKSQDFLNTQRKLPDIFPSPMISLIYDTFLVQIILFLEE